MSPIRAVGHMRRGRAKVVGTVGRAARVAAAVLRALVDRDHPVMAHIIPMRRCNLSCGYCNEYDTTSQPVPLDLVLHRIDLLGRLGTSAITISGGEPLLHPGLDAIVSRIREAGAFATLITNGYLLSPERIQALNGAGLDRLQISIDNVEPDEVSMKSLRLLEPKLRWLAEHAGFEVAVNSVVGAGIANPQDAVAVARRARELGFDSSVGILHDGRGQLEPLGPEAAAAYQELKRLQAASPARVNARWQDRLVRGEPYEWRCRAGSRYLYVDEDGLVSYCSQQRGAPGIPLDRYTVEDIRREYLTRKPCAPYCTINCVQQTALFDNWRAPQTSLADLRGAAAPAGGVVPPSELGSTPGSGLASRRH
jgi:MoaA/NifB/PqqE/SkfB family radical SAM enzyme